MLNERISQNSIAGSVRVIRYLLTALSTSFIEASLVRFAYTPLLPVLIESRWFDTSATVYLSAANSAGALFGAVTSTWLARRCSKVSILRGMNVLATLSLLACAFPISIEWYFFWRFLSGIATGATIVLVAATFLPHVPADRKGVASGLIFAGLGLGIVATGTLVPFLLRFGLRATWIWLAVFAGALTVLTWTSWPPSEFITKREEGTHHRQVPSRPGYLAYLTHLEVALMALTVVAPMLFLVNFVAQDLHAGVYIGSLCWAGYGLGAMLGPPVYGYAADRLGAITALRWTFRPDPGRYAERLSRLGSLPRSPQASSGDSNPVVEQRSFGIPTAIADYLRTSRGVRCSFEQVAIVSGIQEALNLTVRLFLNPGDRLCMENPGYLGASSGWLSN